MVYKVKVCEVCGQEFIPTGGRQKRCKNCGKEKRRLISVLASAVWRQNNPDKSKASSRQWELNNRERVAQNARKWRADNPEKFKESVRLCQLIHPEVQVGISRRHSAKRRALGFVPLNEPFAGCEAHHTDKEHVIHIPKELHHSVYHDQWTGQGMDEINALALSWLSSNALSGQTSKACQRRLTSS